MAGWRKKKEIDSVTSLPPPHSRVSLLSRLPPQRLQQSADLVTFVLELKTVLVRGTMTQWLRGHSDAVAVGRGSQWEPSGAITGLDNEPHVYILSD